VERWVAVRNRSGGKTILHARWCASWLCRMRGLMFTTRLPQGRGLILVGRADDVANASIHMFGVLFSLGVIWISSKGEVVDCRIARPWRVYAPRQAARYVLEGLPEMLDDIEIGDELEFIDETPA
jgi:uncharacterized membrane protein (UPF0127 family)